MKDIIKAIEILNKFCNNQLGCYNCPLHSEDEWKMCHCQLEYVPVSWQVENIQKSLEDSK